MKTNPDTLKVLVVLAKNLHEAKKDVKEKEAFLKEERSILNENMAFQARAMYFALYNAFFIAKRAAGRKTNFN